MKIFYNVYMINVYIIEINNIIDGIEREEYKWVREVECGVELWILVCLEFLLEGEVGEGRIICGGVGKVWFVGVVVGGRCGVGDCGVMEVWEM